MFVWSLFYFFVKYILTHISPAIFLWDIGKQNSPRAILFADMNFIEKCNKNEISLLMPL